MSKNNGNAQTFLKNIFLFCMYKMTEITKQTWEKDGVEVIFFKGKKWLNEKHIEIQLEHSNLPTITNKYPLKLKKKIKITKLWQLSVLYKIFNRTSCNFNNNGLENNTSCEN